MSPDQLIMDIESVFSITELGNGIGMFEADALDNYADESKQAIAREKDREIWPKWQSIPESEISKCYWILCFVDPEGFRFLLPAYMRFSVVHYENSDSASVESPIYALNSGVPDFSECINTLNPEQKHVAAQFLKFMIHQVGDLYVDAVAAKNAYDKYWREFDRDT